MLASFRRIWARRSLLAALIVRDIQAKYVGTALGALWMILQPALMVAFYTFVFGVVFNVRIGATGSPADYALFVLGGLVPWLAFSNGLLGAARSVISNKAIITKVVFPVELLPIASVASAQVGFLVSTVLVVIIAAIVHGLTAQVLWIVVISVLLMIFSLGVGYILAVASTFFKDLSNIVPFVMSLWMYASPVVYASDVVPASFRKFLVLNPIAAVIESYRAAVVYGQRPDLGALVWSAVGGVMIFVFGFWMFRRAQTLFAEVL